MIFNVPGHIEMIRNGLFCNDPVATKPDYSAKGMKEYFTHRAQFLANRPDISKEVKDGSHPLIIKTQTRRLKRGIYQIEAERKKPHKIGYAVQRKRGVKAEPDIRIVFDRIWEEVVQAIYPGKPESYFKIISPSDAFAEGGYTPHDYERIFAKLNPNWNGEGRWAFEFHVIEVRK